MSEKKINPSHYQSSTGLECIECVEAVVENLIGVEATDTGNIMKYLWRWKNKEGSTDLKKARWYLDHLIAHVDNDTDKIKTIEEILIAQQFDELHDED